MDSSCWRVEAPGAPEMIVITGHASVDTAIDALRQGAPDYLTKPVDLARLRAILLNVARRRDMAEEIGGLRGELRDLGRFGALVGRSPPMQRVYEQIARVAPTNATVLITGESGTGKELVAETLHQLSRAQAPFIAINCGAISPNLIESELFGHERGSFTGADRQHRGYFERANGGTLFLDEVTEMPLELQVKLLRVLETGRVVRVGGEQRAAGRRARRSPPPTAIPSRPCSTASCARTSLPAERLPDRPAAAARARRGRRAARRALPRRAQRGRGHAKAPRARRRSSGCARYRWPGNVRELKNVIQRAFILADDEIGPASVARFGPAGSAAAEIAAGGDAMLQVKVGTSIADAERRLILATLEACEGNKEGRRGARHQPEDALQPAEQLQEHSGSRDLRPGL